MSSSWSGGGGLGGGASREEQSGQRRMLSLLKMTEMKLAKVKEIDEAVLGPEGIVVKLSEAEARMSQVAKSRCRIEALLNKIQDGHGELEVDELVDSVKDEANRQQDRVATEEELSREEALKRIDELEGGIKRKLAELKPSVEQLWLFLGQDKERSVQNLTKTLVSQQHKLAGLRDQVNDLKAYMLSVPVPVAEEVHDEPPPAVSY